MTDQQLMDVLNYYQDGIDTIEEFLIDEEDQEQIRILNQYREAMKEAINKIIYAETCKDFS